MNIIDLKQYDVINGLGIRTSIWFAGCSNHCEGCWSPNTWNDFFLYPRKKIVYLELKSILKMKRLMVYLY